MTIEQLGLREFSAFKEVELDFSPGINVLLGASSSGKSHAMKALYAPPTRIGSSRSTRPTTMLVWR